MAAFSIRLASPEDYQEVLGASEGIYNGYDYLPFVFHRWLQDPNRELFVAHLGSKLVGFVSVASIDDGATCYMGTLRIHPSYRRQGLGVRLARDALQRFRLNRGTNFKRERYIIATDSLATTLPLVKKIDPSRELHQCLQHCYLQFPISKDTIRTDPLDLTAMESIRRCSKQELLETLTAGENKQWFRELFPEGLLIVEVTPLEVMVPSNWDGFFEKDIHVLLEKSDPKQNHGMEAISFGVISQRVSVVPWVTTILSTNPRSFKAHLARQLQLACEHVHEENFELILLCDERFASEAKSFFLDEVKLKECHSSFSPVLVFERKHQPLPKEPEVV